MEDKIALRARSGDTKAYAAIKNPVTPEKLNDAAEELARGLAGSPLAALRRALLAQEGSWQGEAPLVDPGADRVRRAVEAAQQTLAEHPFDEERTGGHDCDASSCAAPMMPGEACGGCCRCYGRCLYEGPELGDEEQTTGWQQLLREASVINADVDTPVEEPFGLFYYDDYPGKAVRYRNDLVPDDATMGELATRLHQFFADAMDDESSVTPQIFRPIVKDWRLDDGTPADPEAYYGDMDEIEFTAPPIDPRDELPEDGGIASPDRNWCHVHNKVAATASEECDSCQAEREEADVARRSEDVS